MTESTLKPFYEDGPTKFSPSEYHEFSTLIYHLDDDSNISLFDRMTEIWIDHNHPDYIRVLCLRNILRQTDSITNILSVHCNIHIKFGRLRHLLSGGTTDLFTMLKLQPKLLYEFSSEMLYNLQSGIRQILPYKDPHNDLDALIMATILLVGERVGRQLWTYHSLSNNITAETICQLLDYCKEPPSKEMPAWLQKLMEDQILQAIKGDLQNNLDCYNQVGYILYNTPDPADLCHHRHSIIYVVVCRLYLWASQEAPFARTDFPTRLLQFLEEIIPPHLSYLGDDLYKFIQVVRDVELCYKIARRHIMRSDFEFEPSKKKCLYFIAGVAMLTHPEDEALLHKVQQLIPVK